MNKKSNQKTGVEKLKGEFNWSINYWKYSFDFQFVDENSLHIK